MALTHKYTVVCEHARPEAGGKFIIIGMFPNGIGTPVIPFPLPMLTFFQVFYVGAPGVYKFTGRLSQLDTGSVLANIPPIQIQLAVGPWILPIGLANLQFRAFGLYTWALEVEGQEDPIVTEFEVKHVPQQFQMQPFGGPTLRR